MNRRERFLQTMTFGTPDRPASGDYFFFDSTRERWEREGLPANADLNEYFEMDFDPFQWKVPAELSIFPRYETVVLEETEEYQILQTGREVIKIQKKVPPPAMPMWLSYPLQSREDWDDYKSRLDPETPERLGLDFAELAAKYRQRDYPLGMWLGGNQVRGRE